MRKVVFSNVNFCLVVLKLSLLMSILVCFSFGLPSVFYLHLCCVVVFPSSPYSPSVNKVVVVVVVVVV